MSKNVAHDPMPMVVDLTQVGAAWVVEVVAVLMDVPAIRVAEASRKTVDVEVTRLVDEVATSPHGAVVEARSAEKMKDHIFRRRLVSTIAWIRLANFESPLSAVVIVRVSSAQHGGKTISS